MGICRRRRFGMSVGLGVLVAAVSWLLIDPPTRTRAAAVSPGPHLQNPDARCAGCHAEIYRSYQLTAMGRGSGEAREGFLPGQLHHALSDVDYRVFLRDGAPYLSFHRDPSRPKGGLDGERKLEYYVGSARRGRTFLYQQDGLWFQSPINYYARQGGWDMAPSYYDSTHMPSALAVDASCLHCHATGVPATEGARNRFAGPPFTQGGVGCSTCHGDPTEHLAHAGHTPMVNPDTLPVAARDSACIQCHLEGNAVVSRPGRSLAQFKVGDKLQDLAVYFVFASQTSGGARATSQYEALLQSACKRSSGDRLTCTTCHDPHSSPPPEKRVEFFRGKCLSCHTGAAIATRHHPEQRDCAVCHMPTRDTTDISHAQVTDHNIERHPVEENVHDDETLVPVGNFAADDRDLGLAYAQLAQHGNRTAGEKALGLLSRAEKAGRSDEQLHLNLGFLDQVSGRADEARKEYALALEGNPQDVAALSNLAVLNAVAGNVQGSLRMLQQVVTEDPSQTSAGLNLAFLQCSLGQVAEAQQTAARVRTLDPDSPELRELLRTGRYAGQRCAQMATAKPD